jgi:hypothetical protein
MAKNYFNLRKMIAIAISLAALTVFSACGEEEPTDDPTDGTEQPGDSGDDVLWCDPNTDALSTALRNVHIRYSYQTPRANCKDVVLAEAMGCAGRLYVRGTHSEYDFCKTGFNNHTIEIFEPPIAKFYSLDDIEWHQNDVATCYPTIVSRDLFLGNGIAQALEHYYYTDRTAKYWDSPDVYGGAGWGFSITTWRKDEAGKTIAGVQCVGYSINETFEQGTLYQEIVLHKVWYDAKTNVVMRYEEYNDDNELIYWFEINEIEYGKVKKEDLDAILNEWLKTNNPKDISGEDRAGEYW